MLRKAFTEHPASVGESYFEHMTHASGFGLRMIAGGIACFIHGIFPFLCIKTGNRQIATLHNRMVTSRVKSNDGWSYVI